MKSNCQECPMQGTKTCETCPFPVMLPTILPAAALNVEDQVGDYASAGRRSQYEMELAASQPFPLSEDDILAERSIAV